MRRECAPFLGFRRDPRCDRSNLAATPVSPPGGGEGSGERGRVCEDIGSKNGQHPGTVILPFSGTVTLPRNIVLLGNRGFGKMSNA